VNEQPQQQQPPTVEEVERLLLEIDHDAELDPSAIEDRIKYLANVAAPVTNEAEATAAVERIRRAEDEYLRAKEAAASYVAERLRRWEARKMIYGAKLEEWTRERLRGSKQRSVKLLSGVTGFRHKIGGKLEIENELALREWVEAHLPEAINYRQAPFLKEALNAHVEKTGEVPPGTRKTEDQDTFYVGGPRG
jgi:uncharacterized protein YhaN